MGIATVMSPFDFTNFWGDHWDTIDPTVAQLIGFRGATQQGTCAQQMLDEHLLFFGDPRIDPTCYKPNARILMQELKAPDIKQVFIMPGKVHGTPPKRKTATPMKGSSTRRVSCGRWAVLAYGALNRPSMKKHLKPNQPKMNSGRTHQAKDAARSQ